MASFEQKTLFPQVLYYPGSGEDTPGIEAAVADAGAILNVWEFKPEPEQSLYLGADNSAAAKAARVAGARMWEKADAVLINSQLPPQRICGIALGAQHLGRPAALLTERDSGVATEPQLRYPSLRATTVTRLGGIIRAVLDDENNRWQNNTRTS